MKAREVYGDADVIIMHAPAVVDGGTLTIEVTDDEDATAASTWRTFQIGDPYADAAPPPAGKSRPYFELSACAAYRLKASVATGAERTWAQEKSFSV
jgi:hypothetical protein